MGIRKGMDNSKDKRLSRKIDKADLNKMTEMKSREREVWGSTAIVMEAGY